ncbi:GH35 family endo-1,4-beta-xylanase [Arthrobacter stackebrandtii]|uniref:Beta-xylanase n=1 Tax=Arthrobacter stackebrandtii TaxID=272161 RepID=A0ABS4YU93_9MICC|nr:endo-1,4-beta-xylanase [Arthrobacter stackebrandtii]MBP2412170.1 GH35 family endo-1,4-beta-xylanase [Arthrobacter stackebrandtii]PYH01963.1 1,4-beta-xylanase [Arthrobacter stackebrandtii]
MTSTDRYAHRKVNATITVTDELGRPLSGRPITVAQRQHAFGFGCTPPDMAEESGETRELWTQLFDTATLAFYWGRYEPVRGVTDREGVLRCANWLANRGVRLKGHPLVWHTVKAPWVDELPLSEAEELLRGRIRREVGDFAGVVDSWDAINEVVIMPDFVNEPDDIKNAITRMCAEKGRVAMVALAVEEARSQNPEAQLILNDFDLGPRYERLVEEVLAAGITIDAIGLQSHMHQGFRGEDQLNEICNRFARFGLPLHWTETTILSGDLMPPEIEDLNDYVVADWPTTTDGEARQAEDIVRHYSALVAHPAVESITYWGFDDAGAWLGAPVGFLRADGTQKPSYSALRDLIRGEWWLDPVELVTDNDGRIQFDAFAGSFDVASGDSHVLVDLAAGPAQVDLQLPA